ncbi:MAG: sigma-70 family RNA polymerase sigma factor [Chloroflexota bacterium]
MIDRGSPSDEDLVRLAQVGELAAFDTLYERYLPIVFGRVRCVIPESDVEDVTQEVFIAVIKSLDGFRFEAKFSTWLRTLVNRQVADYYRTRKPQEPNLSIELIGEESERNTKLSTDGDFENQDNVIILRQALKQLPENYREVIVLRFVEGLRFEEIARLQGQSLEATKSLFRRAIATLSKRVQNG